nr:putative ribonuclease H-like domain-containing protein [Tanacetum cinerariifolium]
MVAADDDTSKDKEIDKLMALISLHSLDDWTTFKNWNFLVCPRELVWRILEKMMDKFMISFGVNVSLDSGFPLNVITRHYDEVVNRCKILSRDIIEFCASKGIKREYSNARTPQQNGVAERKNRTLIVAARIMLAYSFLPNTFWAEAVSTACYVLNRPVTSENKANKTAGPKEANNRIEANNVDEKLNGDTSSKTTKEPVDQEDQAFLEELESLKRQAKEVDDAAETLRKTFAKSIEDLLLQAGVSRANSTNNVNTSTTPVNTASLLRNVCATGPSYPDLSNYANQDDSQIPSLEDIYEVLKDGIFISASYDDEGVVADFTNFESTVNHCLYACFLSHIEPKKISQALEDKSWVDAMQEELLLFKTQQVWILVDLPFGKKVIGTKWIYKNKKDKQGVVVRNKARIEAIGIFLAFASYMGFIVYQMDVKSALFDALAIPEQTTTGKETSNQFMAGSLPKTTSPS